MLTWGEPVRNLLRMLHLYEQAHKVWIRRPDPHILCWNAGYRIAGAEDHLPIPPTRYINLVIYGSQIARFLICGSISQENISFVLQKNGIHIEELKEILDFGCGCGRVLRHWKPLKGQHFYGTDYNPELIAWCQRNLGRIAQFKINQLVPPLDYPDEKFAFIYAISVFTHLTEDLQFAWMKELARLLQPDGLLYMTVHGLTRLPQLNAQERQQFMNGHLVVKQKESAGTNFCASFHPEQYVRSVLAQGFEVLDYIMSGAREADQDIYLLRKQAGIH